MANHHAAATQVISANHLLNGAVVYLGCSGQWTVSLQDAQVFENREQGAAAIEQLATVDNDVVGVELVGVNSCGTNGPEPLRLREQLRAHGPSIAFGHTGTSG